jgi:hypothetical protein
MNDGSGGLATIDSLTDASNFIHINVWDARKFDVGMSLEVWTTRDTGAVQKAFGTSGAPVYIDTVSKITPHASDASLATLTVTGGFDGTATMAATHILTIAGARTSIARYEMSGIDAAIDNKDAPIDGTFQDIQSNFQYDGTTLNGSPEAAWNSQVFPSTAARPPTERVFQRAKDAVEIHANGKEIDKWICGYGARLEFAVTQTNVRRSVNTRRISGSTGGGFQEDTTKGDYLEYGNAPICPNRFCDPSVIYGVVWEDLEMYYWARQQWWDEDGSVIRRSPERKTTYEAENFAVCEFALGARNAHARIENVEHNEQLLL